MDLDPGASCKLSIFCSIKSAHPECSSICNSHKATNSQDGVHINDMDVAFHLNTLFLKGVASAQQNGLGSNFCLPPEGQEVVNLVLLVLLVLLGIISFFLSLTCLQTSYKVLLDYRGYF